MGAPPALNDDQIEIVFDTWKSVKKLGIVAIDIFYEELFKAHPELRHTMFKETDFEKQKLRLFSMLNQTISWLNEPEELVPML